MKPDSCCDVRLTEKSKKKGKIFLSFLFLGALLLAVTPAAVFAAWVSDDPSGFSNVATLAVDSSDNVYAGGVESTSTGQTGKVSKFDGVFQ